MATTIWWPCDLRPRLRWVVPAQDGAANFSNTQHEGRTWHITFEKPPWNLHQSLQYSGCSVEQLASALNVIYPSSPRNAPSSVSRSLYLLPIPYLFKVVEARDMVELEEASTSVAALTSLKSAVLKRKTMPSQWARDKLFQDLSADGWRSTDLLQCINGTTVHNLLPHEPQHWRFVIISLFKTWPLPHRGWAFISAASIPAFLEWFKSRRNDVTALRNFISIRDKLSD